MASIKVVMWVIWKMYLLKAWCFFFITSNSNQLCVLNLFFIWWIWLIFMNCTIAKRLRMAFGTEIKKVIIVCIIFKKFIVSHCYLFQISPRIFLSLAINFSIRNHRKEICLKVGMFNLVLYTLKSFWNWSLFIWNKFNCSIKC